MKKWLLHCGFLSLGFLPAALCFALAVFVLLQPCSAWAVTEAGAIENKYHGSLFVMSQRAFNVAKAQCETKDTDVPLSAPGGVTKTDLSSALKGQSNGDLLLALAIRFSDCAKPFIDPVTGAIGPLLIDREKISELTQAFSGETDGDTSTFVEMVQKNSTFAAKASAKFWQDNYFSKYGTTGGICAQADETEQYNALGWCFASKSTEIIQKMLEGKEIFCESEGSLESENYGQTTCKTTDGEVVATTVNCHDGETSLYKTLAGARNTYAAGKAEAARQTYFTTVANMNKSKAAIEIVDGGMDALCIEKIFFYYDLIAALQGGAHWLESLIAEAVIQVIDAACDYIIDELYTAVENLLNKVCLSIPSLSGFELGTANVESEGCNGQSFADIKAQRAGGVRLDIKGAFHDLLSATGLLQAVPSDRKVIPMPKVGTILREIFDGTKEE